MAYETFIRNWWRKDAQGRIVPNTGDRGRRTGDVYESQDEARAACREYNEGPHAGGWQSRKMEYRSC